MDSTRTTTGASPAAAVATTTVRRLPSATTAGWACATPSTPVARSSSSPWRNDAFTAGVGDGELTVPDLLS